MAALLRDQHVIFLESLWHVAGLKGFLSTAISLEGKLLVSPTAFGLLATNKTDLVRCAESQGLAIVAAILCDHFLFVAAIGTGTHAGRISFSAAMSLMCCLAKTVIAQLSFTLLKTAAVLLELRRRKKLLSMATEQYSKLETSKPVLSADR